MMQMLHRFTFGYDKNMDHLMNLIKVLKLQEIEPTNRNNTINSRLKQV